MEKKRARAKGTNYFPKAASFGVPRKTVNTKVVYTNKAFSGPMVFNVSAREPKSPEVSCMGQVKLRSKSGGTGTGANAVHKLLIVICHIFRTKVRLEKGREDVGTHSEPRLILMAGVIEVEPKVEVNLWKRRTVAPPIPLLLSS